MAVAWLTALVDECTQKPLTDISIRHKHRLFITVAVSCVIFSSFAMKNCRSHSFYF